MNKEVLEQIMQDRLVRQAVTRESHALFFHVYFPHYVKYPIAEFQKEIFRITEDQTNKLACIVAFRGSGKSTLITMSYALWAILGIQQKKFVLIICQTQQQAKQQMANIRNELETNKVLKSDLGPFQEEGGGEWAMSSLVFTNTSARIMIASVDQSIRGSRHRENRPDLIIGDDVEDLNSVKTFEGRNKVFDWFTREIIPLGDIDTRIILVGNLLHEDSLMMRLKKRITSGEMHGTFKWFPLIDEKGVCLWPGKFDSPEKLEDLRKSVGNELAWRQEYLLEIVSDSTKVILPEWIKFYSQKEMGGVKVNTAAIGVDLAISQKTEADYTAMVVIKACEHQGKRRYFVEPHPIKERIHFKDAINKMAILGEVYNAQCCDVMVVLETNGFQEVYMQLLSEKIDSVSIIGVKNLIDKRFRLAMTSTFIREGDILFPEKGCEELIAQLTGFGIENKDDLADAFANAIIHLIEESQNQPNISFI